MSDRKRKRSKKRMFMRSTSAGGAKKTKVAFSNVDPVKNVKSILISTNKGKERDCAMEMVNWLSELADKYYANTEAAKRIANPAAASSSSSSSSGENRAEEVKIVSSALEAELAELRAETDGTPSSSAVIVGDRFQNVPNIKTCAKQNMVMIQILDDEINPADLVLHLLREVNDTGRVCSRFAQRITPMQGTCFSKMQEFEDMAKTIIESFFKDVPRPASYMVRWNRYAGLNKAMDRMECIKLVARLMPSGFRVDFKTPDYIIDLTLVTRMMGMCAMKYDPLFDRMNVNPKGAEEKKSKNEAEAVEEEEEEDKADQVDSEKKDESKEEVTAAAHGEADTARPSDQISTDA